jgi:SAM-dependent methyltransferase
MRHLRKVMQRVDYVRMLIVKKESMRVLVVIANYGRKNQRYLERLLQEYRAMPFDIKVLVLSNISKDLGSDVEVSVGLPIKDPWSLPFGYKEIFARRFNEHDLFIYSEDDTLITERNISSFLRVTEILPENKIAGFLRYEIGPDGTKYYSTIHGTYHWDPNSVFKIGQYIFARHTNDHSACFILTREQLKKSIASGGFSLPPRKGRYDMLVTAATEPYTVCGMEKVICISHLENFCLRHLPDVYLGRIGIRASIADMEVEKLKGLLADDWIRGPLFKSESLLECSEWDAKYYEPARSDILSFVPGGVKRVLSVGCGCGSTEELLVEKGIEVVGIPMDCVVAVSSAARGVKTLSPSFSAPQRELEGEQFDCIIFRDVLNHLPDPVSTLKSFRPLLRKGGWFLFSVPNFDHISVLKRRLAGRFPSRRSSEKRSFEKYGVHFTNWRMVKVWLKHCGLRTVRQHHIVEPRYQGIDRLSHGLLRGMLRRNIVVLAERVE